MMMIMMIVMTMVMMINRYNNKRNSNVNILISSNTIFITKMIRVIIVIMVTEIKKCHKS